MAKRVLVVSRRWLGGVLLLLALALVVAGWSTGWWSGTAQGTAIVIYDPEGFTAVETRPGSCWTGSLAAPREGAFRCASENVIYDPCFLTAGGTVACPQGDPAQNQSVVLELTDPLPQPPDAWTNPPDRANPSPWFLRLVGGGECGVLTGTRPPEYPLGCQLPQGPEGTLCSLPAALAAKPTRYGVLCGVWDPQHQQLRQPTIYEVEAMWL